MLLMQLPGADEAIKSASQDGWTAVVLVIIIFSAFSFFAYMFRTTMADAKERESRLNSRVNHLEDLINNQLFSVITHNSEIMVQVTASNTAVAEVCTKIMAVLSEFETVLRERPCMAMDAAERIDVIENLVGGRRGEGNAGS